MKKYVGLFLSLSLLLTACGKNESSSVPLNENSETSVTDVNVDESVSSTENEGLSSETPTEDISASTVDDKIGINSMRVDAEELTDEQKMLISYNDNNYFSLNNYELLQRYPDAFDNSQAVFTGQVDKILSADDKTYSVLVTMNEYRDNVFISQNKVVINGNHADNYSDVTKNYRIIAGDQIKCFGNGIGHFTRYNLSFIKDLANAMFPSGIKIREPIQGQDFDINGTWDGIHDYSDMFLIGEPDNQSNDNFTRYEFYQSRGYIRDNKSTADIIRQLKMSLDMQHYILTIYDSALKTFTIEYYDLSYNKLWSREFENASIYQYSTMRDNDFFDYTESAIYLDLNNNLYIIDIETGEDKISPVTVGEKTDIRKTADGILLMSDSMTDTVMKTDLDGNILWKLDLPLYDSETRDFYLSQGADFDIVITAIQFDENSIKIEYNYAANKYNEEYNYTETLWSESKIFVIDNDGNMLMNTEVL